MTRRKRIALLLVFVVAGAAVSPASAQRPTSPFQVGSSYTVVFGANGGAIGVRVLSAPDANGFASVVLLSGDPSVNSQQTWINVRQALLVTTMEAGAAGAAGGMGAAPAGAPGNAALAAVRSDLRNLVTAEESFFADNVTYTPDIRRLSYTTSYGVTVTLIAANGTGWSARATHTGAPGYVCGIFVGSAASPMAGANEGEPVCRRSP